MSIVAVSGVTTEAEGPKGPVRVFILAGQSNMEGKALASTKAVGTHRRKQLSYVSDRWRPD